ncbi:MAG TPA: hypothetical protein VGM12_17325, partial [Trebonia sp.]
LGIPVTDADGQVVNQGLALIPRTDLSLEDTWFVAGMKSSGSNCLVAVDTARLHAYRAAGDIDDAAARGEYPGYLTRARVRSDTGYVAECVTKAIDILLYAHGAGSFADVSPLQRIWRDSATAARHAVVSPQVSYEVYGKALLGVEDNITPLI